MINKILLLLATCFIAACSAEHEAPLVATDVVVLQPVPGSAMRAGYLSLTNNSDELMTIDRVASPQFSSVEMHETLIEDGIARMRPIDEIALAPGQTVRFERGAKHLMLMQAVGDAATVTLQFYAADSLLLSVVAGQEQMQGQ